MVSRVESLQMKLFPGYGWIGIVLLIGAWIINWTFTGLRTHWGFFFQWLGYILFIDAIIFSKKGTSLFTSNKFSFSSLFLISIPFWWLFEVLNNHMHSWSYEARERFTDLEYFLLASLNFSTVVPAMLETFELLSLTNIFKKKLRGPLIKKSKMTAVIFFFLGIAMLSLNLMYPGQLPYFLWMSLYFIFDSLNYFLRLPTLLNYTTERNWTPVFQLFLAGLICGFFWELWNYYSFPKWHYHLAGFEYLYVFEMPLAGYLGYLPFALELWAYYQLLKGLSNRVIFKLN